jgi:hypothetical protein
MFKLLAEKRGDFFTTKSAHFAPILKNQGSANNSNIQSFVCKKCDTNFFVLPFFVLVCYSGIPHIIVL